MKKTIKEIKIKRSKYGITLKQIPKEHLEIIKKRAKELEPLKMLVLHPIQHEILGWIDYVYAKDANGKLLLRAFQEPNRVEESSKALFELDEYLEQLKKIRSKNELDSSRFKRIKSSN